jgi:hypothetical protein
MAFKVGDDYRENPMSLRPGGYTVYVERTDGKILEYDKIKFPWRFVAKIKKENPGYKAWWK